MSPCSYIPHKGINTLRRVTANKLATQVSVRTALLLGSPGLLLSVMYAWFHAEQECIL